MLFAYIPISLILSALRVVFLDGSVICDNVILYLFVTRALAPARRLPLSRATKEAKCPERHVSANRLRMGRIVTFTCLIIGAALKLVDSNSRAAFHCAVNATHNSRGKSPCNPLKWNGFDVSNCICFHR